MIKHIDLFSGIGGLSYALDTIFYDYAIEHVFADNNPFCQAVLKKHWPTATIYGDIRSLTNTKNAEQQLAMEREPYKKTTIPSDDCFIVTGGFPCQPFSAAGRRKGTADDRYLWPEMYRVIKEFQPEWVVAENVRGLATWSNGMVLEQVCTDLENAGYEVQPLIIPAVALNAPHRRDRIWFVAYRASNRRERGGSSISNKKGYEARPEQTGKLPTRSEGSHSHAPHTNNERPKWRSEQSEDGEREIHSGRRKDKTLSESKFSRGDVTDTERQRGVQKGQSAPITNGKTFPWDGSHSWKQHWVEIATELCSVDDGISERLGNSAVGVRGGYAVMPGGEKGKILITKASHRKEQLKAYGNAIVPQVAMEIFKAIKQTL